MHGFRKVPPDLALTSRMLARVSVIFAILADAGPMLAAPPGPQAETAAAHPAHPSPPRRAEAIVVTGHTSSPAADIKRFSLPQTVESTDWRRIEATTNIVDAEDALKYLPSLFLRKRNNGDTQATLQTRTWGVNSSARSLVYVDDMPISALISNNNTNGAPRWGMVAPEQIERVDMLYGPFAAEYPGNSMGGVVLITTRMPDRFEATVKQTGSVQSFDAYNTHGTYGTASSAITIGDRIGRFSWFVSANREESLSEPLFFITSGQAPAGTAGTIPALGKTGTAANVVGAGGLLHSTMNNVTGRFAYDVTDWLRASYTIGFWTIDARARSQTYLTDAAGQPTFGGVSGFANDTYTQSQRHLMNAVSLKTDTKAHWDWEAVFTDYAFLRDMQRNPAGVLSGTEFRSNGYLARMDGTGWTTADVKGIWRPGGVGGQHQVSFGGHRDQYDLNNPTYNTDNWMASPIDGNGTLYASGRGKSSTYALWLQDAWTFTPAFTLTVGGRLEFWRAFDGANLAGTTAVAQPRVRSTNASPKVTMAWRIAPGWNAKFSFGEAYRYPTVAELYQIVATGGTYSVPNPDLSPENVYSGELTVERRFRKGRIRLSLFQENVKNALISQSNLIGNIYTTTFQNVRQVRNRGVEFVAERHDLLIPGLDVSNSVTYVDSRILSDPGFSSAAGTTATGKHVPYVPNWRDTAQVTYRANDRLDLSVAVRYQGRMYSTLDNTDRVSHVFGAFDPFVVVDLHAHYRVYRSLTLDAGIDNVNNDRYYEYHPFPMRTYVADLKARF